MRSLLTRITESLKGIGRRIGIASRTPRKEQLVREACLNVARVMARGTMLRQSLTPVEKQELGRRIGIFKLDPLSRVDLPNDCVVLGVFFDRNGFWALSIGLKHFSESNLFKQEQWDPRDMEFVDPSNNWKLIDYQNQWPQMDSSKCDCERCRKIREKLEEDGKRPEDCDELKPFWDRITVDPFCLGSVCERYVEEHILQDAADKKQ